MANDDAYVTLLIHNKILDGRNEFREVVHTRDFADAKVFFELVAKTGVDRLGLVMGSWDGGKNQRIVWHAEADASGKVQVDPDLL